MSDRRLFPRYSLSRPLSLRGGQGDRFDAQITEISVEGVGFVVSRAVAVALAQGGSVLTPGDELQLNLPGITDPIAGGDLQLDSRVRHVRRLSRDQYLVGALFDDLGAAPAKVLAELVEQARQARWKSFPALDE